MIQVFVEDINLDGYPEVKAVTDHYIAIIDTKNGGTMTEFDVRDQCFNYQNTLTRRKEAYHYKMLEATEQSQEHAEADGSTRSTRRTFPNSAPCAKRSNSILFEKFVRRPFRRLRI